MPFPIQRGYGPKKRTAADKKAAAVSLLLWRPKLGEDEVSILMRSYGQSEKNARQLVEDEKARRSGLV